MVDIHPCFLTSSAVKLLPVLLLNLTLMMLETIIKTWLNCITVHVAADVNWSDVNAKVGSPGTHNLVQTHSNLRNTDIRAVGNVGARDPTIATVEAVSNMGAQDPRDGPCQAETTARLNQHNQNEDADSSELIIVGVNGESSCPKRPRGEKQQSSKIISLS